MKKYIVTAAIGLIIFGTMQAFKKNNTTDKKITAAQINAAVIKSLPLLQRSSHDFLENAATCHSCHNQGIGLVAFALAKENGFPVADSVIKEAVDSTCNFWKTGENMRELYEQNDPVATVMTGNYDMWALSVNGYKPTKPVQLLALDIMRKQTSDGSWMSPGQRPPLEYYSFTATALSVRNMQVYVPAAWQAEMQQRIVKARNWMVQTIPETNEEKVFQLLGLNWCHADKKFIAVQATKLLAAQQSDGGWSQLDSLKSDAYATGQSLYALRQSGLLNTEAPAYQKGLEFLISTQLPDGSWHVKTRSYPFVPYVTSGFPHENDEFISAAGSNWAVIVLASSKN